MSDIDIVVCIADDNAPVGDEAHEAQDSSHNVLQQFPGHRMILSLSPYFEAQARLTCFNCRFSRFRGPWRPKSEGLP